MCHTPSVAGGMSSKSSKGLGSQAGTSRIWSQVPSSAPTAQPPFTSPGVDPSVVKFMVESPESLSLVREPEHYQHQAPADVEKLGSLREGR